MINIKLNVKDYVEKQKIELKEKFRSITTPKLFIFTDNKDDVATQSYMKNKIKVGNELGVDVEVKNIETIDELKKIYFQCKDNMIPTILQLPVKNKRLEYIYNLLYKDYDIDGFYSYSQIYNSNYNNIIPATPKGIIYYIEEWANNKGYKNTQNFKVTIIGRGKLVGKPLVTLLTPRVGTLYLLTSKSSLEEKKYAIKNSDVVILATGNTNSLDGIDDFGENKIIIDTGIFRDENNKLCGELTKHIHKLDKSIDYTSVPGGVGLLTTLNLFKNVYNFYEM